MHSRSASSSPRTWPNDFARMDRGPKGTTIGPWVLFGYVGDDEYEWFAQVQSSVGWFGRLLGKSDRAEREQVARILHQLLTSDPTFRTVRWHQGDFAEENWVAEP
jgi:hypothetical protein